MPDLLERWAAENKERALDLLLEMAGLDVPPPMTDEERRQLDEILHGG